MMIMMMKSAFFLFLFLSLQSSCFDAETAEACFFS